jgi:hypothetical protein
MIGPVEDAFAGFVLGRELRRGEDHSKPLARLKRLD